MHPARIAKQTAYSVTLEDAVICAVYALAFIVTVAFAVIELKIVMGIHVTPHRMFMD